MKWTVVFALLLVLVLNVSARRGHHGHQRRRPKPVKPNKCFPLLPHCEQCTKFTCDRCETGYVRDGNPLGYGCKRQCRRGYTPIEGTCVDKGCMGVSNCAKCARNGMCTGCLDGFFLLKSAKRNGPTKCVASCPEGFVSRNPWFSAPYCVEEGCSGAYCLTCKAGWYRVYNSHKKCHRIRTCPPGTAPTGKSCVRCRDHHCQKCENRFTCAACEDGYILFNGFSGVFRQCHRKPFFKCPKGYKEEVNPLGGVRCKKECEVKNCESCPGYFRTTCDKCKTDFYKLTGRSRFQVTCVSQCPDGYYHKPTSNGGKECIKECDVKNCESCPGYFRATCDKCKADFYKLTWGFVFKRAKCVSQCPDGYYDIPTSNGGKECIKGTPTTTEPMTSPEPATEPEPTTEPETTTGWGTSPEPTTEYEPTTTPEPITEPEYITTPEPTTEPEATTTAEPEFSTTTPEPTTEPEATTTAEPESSTTTPEPTTEPEATTTAEPESSSTTPEPTTEPEATSSSPTTDDWDEEDWP